jgi:hypothetical protein
VLVECSRIATEIGFAGVLPRYRAMPCCQSDLVTRVKRRIVFESGEARRTSQGGSTRIGESDMNLYAPLISTRFNVWRDVMAYNEKNIGGLRRRQATPSEELYRPSSERGGTSPRRRRVCLRTQACKAEGDSSLIIPR